MPLRPVVAQWDRLSRAWSYMLIMRGPVKVDLIFGQPHATLPPRRPAASTLQGIDDHFWDWMLWLRSKQAAGRLGIVAAELGELHEHLLGPLGVKPVPQTIERAVTEYQTARAECERQLGMRVPRTAQDAVIRTVCL
jgi:hypothetical protein